jgi:hypothetical protein
MLLSAVSRASALAEATMNRGLLLVLGMTLWSGSASAQGIQLAWLSCIGDRSSSYDVTFDCNPAHARVYPLCGTFQIPARAPGIVSLQGIVDFRFQTAAVPPFWHLETGGCDVAGIALSSARPVGCEAYQAEWCDSTGAACEPAVLSYFAGYGGMDRARLVFSVSRLQGLGRDLDATPARHFAFHLDFAMGNAATCTGCTTMARITWSELDLYSAGGLVRAVVSSDPESRPDTFVNDLPVPIGGPTWGRLKALYR